MLLFIHPVHPEELPIPNYDNAVIASIEHSIFDSAEIDYIKNNFDFGLYAWLSFSRTAFGIALDWHSDLSSASAGIQAFKDSVDAHITATKQENVRLHLVLVAGLTRRISIYYEAKEEDIRNCQWYNDNKLAADDQIGDSEVLDRYVFGTLSRYARKVRANLEAKAKASLAFLKDRMDAEPETLLALSGWGEVEMNFHRLIPTQSVQDYFCDYSPFAVLEFRDWIQHTGMYDAFTGQYKGEGYAQGGTKYQGAGGLTQFNADFGTSFTTWDLEYFHWDLIDDYDTIPEDYVNDDPHRIPLGDYSHGNMMPASGPNYTAGGFDPPRVMQPGNNFWDLWNLFRETMVYYFIKDMAKWSSEAGIPASRWFSHQIAADYLWGTHPGMTHKNARYYSSASPLWTADIQPLGSVGATMYDIKYPDRFARTSQYGVPAISAMASNWGIMEWDPEAYPVGLTVPQSNVATILEQHLRLYDYNVHFINFWKWLDPGEMDAHTIKGFNKEEALRQFIAAIRDKARRTNFSTVFTPPKVIDVSGSYIVGTGAIRILVSGKIWTGHDWEWPDWGDFSHFEIYRSSEPNFTPNVSDRIGTTTAFSYDDSSFAPGNAYFYKLRAVNSASVGGPYSEEVMVIPSTTPVAVLSVDKKLLRFGAVRGTTTTPPESVVVMNLDTSSSTINWSVSPQAAWIEATPLSGSGDASVEIGVSVTGLSAGNYSGQVWVQDPNAFNSPQIVQVELTVYDQGTDSPPIGYFDTPIHNATVSGSIPVTGWALDDVEVTKVEIKRDPHPDDPIAAIGGDGLVYIGDALFVRGSRPDVAVAYPNYPRNDIAGWGYMMLTFGLPRRGNDTFVIYAVAYDGNGHRKVLGDKTIIADNDSRIKPFGAIDTPAPGGIASGAVYTNFGWALTPFPKWIPYDGSTIWVFVDGVALGNPVYGEPRQIIADMFPECLNKDGPVGYYYLDTTQYENGIHTIAWSATDNEGAVDGIGSRYFTIQNLGGTIASVGKLSPMQYETDSSGRLWIGVERVERGFRKPGVRIKRQGLRNLSSVQRIKKIDNPLHLENNPSILDPDFSSQFIVHSQNRYEITTEELERVVIKLEGKGSSRFIGWGRDETLRLPIGSTLDAENGIFYWMPGPGFLGKHVLNFAVTKGTFKSEPITVIIDIKPKRYTLKD